MTVDRILGRARNAAMAVAVLAFAAPAAADIVDKDRKAIEEIVHQYILEHPEVIAEAIDRLRERERIAQEEAQRQAKLTLAPLIYENPQTPEMGNAKGDVTVVEFFDYQCGYCKQVFPAVMNVLNADKNIRVLWKELPILGPVSRFASRAAMAADKQGKYFKYHVALMELKGRLTEDRVMETAHAVGLDMKQLITDMASPEIERYLSETLELAQSLGINGTPAFLFGDQLVPGAVGEDKMRELIALARETKG
ncbi:MAG: DsbA family protein [Proteobacteria bacterium]|nr:DsbA family protein [Pseudomonadota bacterium]